MAAAEPVGVVDFAYLEGFTAGDKTVVREVLGLFLQQAKTWVAGLDPGNPGWTDVVHTVKGSARGIGANALGDICAKAETEGPSALPSVMAALNAAVAEITAYQGHA